MSMPPTGPEAQGPGVPPPGQPYGQPSDTPPAYSGAPAPGYGQQPAGYGQPPLSDSDRRLWAMLGHLSGIILGFIGPIIVWAIYKDRDEFVKDQSTEALNFQITLLIAYVVSAILMLVFIGFITYFLVWIASIVFAIMGGLAANKGERYRYPFALRLVK